MAGVRTQKCFFILLSVLFFIFRFSLFEKLALFFDLTFLKYGSVSLAVSKEQFPNGGGERWATKFVFATLPILAAV